MLRTPQNVVRFIVVTAAAFISVMVLIVLFDCSVEKQMNDAEINLKWDHVFVIHDHGR